MAETQRGGFHKSVYQDYLYQEIEPKNISYEKPIQRLRTEIDEIKEALNDNKLQGIFSTQNLPLR